MRFGATPAALGGIGKLPAAMRPATAMRLDATVFGGQPVVGFMVIADDDTIEGRQCRREPGLQGIVVASLMVVEQDHGSFRRPGPDTPEVTLGLGFSPRFLQHLQGGLVQMPALCLTEFGHEQGL